MSTAGLMTAEVLAATKTTRDEIVAHDKQEEQIENLSIELNKAIEEYDSARSAPLKRQILIEVVAKSQALVTSTKTSSAKIKTATADLLKKVENLTNESTNLIEASSELCQYIEVKNAFIQAFYAFSNDTDQVMDDEKFRELDLILQQQYKKYKQLGNPCIWCFVCNRVCHSRIQEKDIDCFNGTDIPKAVKLQSSTAVIKAIIEKLVNKCPEGVSNEVSQGYGIRIPRLRDSIIYGQKGQPKHVCCGPNTKELESKRASKEDDSKMNDSIRFSQRENKLYSPRVLKNALVDRVTSVGIPQDSPTSGEQAGIGGTEGMGEDQLYLGKRKDSIKHIAKIYRIIEPEEPDQERVYICGAKNKRTKVRLQPIEYTEEDGWLVCKQFKMVLVSAKSNSKISPENDSDEDKDHGEDGSDGGSNRGDDDPKNAGNLQKGQSKFDNHILLGSTVQSADQRIDKYQDDNKTADTDHMN